MSKTHPPTPFFAIRSGIAVGLSIGIYREAGPFTAVAFALIAVSIEAISWYIRRTHSALEEAVRITTASNASLVAATERLEEIDALIEALTDRTKCQEPSHG